MWILFLFPSVCMLYPCALIIYNKKKQTWCDCAYNCRSFLCSIFFYWCTNVFLHNCKMPYKKDSWYHNILWVNGFREFQHKLLSLSVYMNGILWILKGAQESVNVYSISSLPPPFGDIQFMFRTLGGAQVFQCTYRQGKKQTRWPLFLLWSFLPWSKESIHY